MRLRGAAQRAALLPDRLQGARPASARAPVGDARGGARPGRADPGGPARADAGRRPRRDRGLPRPERARGAGAGSGATAAFVHSTRQQGDHPLLCRFDEPHSHAASHLIYRPARRRPRARSARWCWSTTRSRPGPRSPISRRPWSPALPGVRADRRRLAHRLVGRTGLARAPAEARARASACSRGSLRWQPGAGAGRGRAFAAAGGRVRVDARRGRFRPARRDRAVRAARSARARAPATRAAHRRHRRVHLPALPARRAARAGGP